MHHFELERIFAFQKYNPDVFENLTIGKHRITVQAFDDAGNASKIGKATVTVRDTTPPEQVTGLTASVALDQYKARLSWDSGTDNTGKIAGYEILLDDGKIRKSSKNSLNVSNLSVGTHTYQIRVIDANRNVGEWSDIAAFTVRDITAPGKVAAKAKVDGNTLTLSWTAPKDNVGVTGYILKYGADLEETATLDAGQLNFRIDNLAKGKYQYQIVAVDAAGNQSKVKSGRVTIKTALTATATLNLAPDMLPSLAFASASTLETQSSLPQLDQMLPEVGALTANEALFAAAALDGLTDTERKTLPLFAIGA